MTQWQLCNAIEAEEMFVVRFFFINDKIGLVSDQDHLCSVRPVKEKKHNTSAAFFSTYDSNHESL